MNETFPPICWRGKSGGSLPDICSRILPEQCENPDSPDDSIHKGATGRSKQFCAPPQKARQCVQPDNIHILQDIVHLPPKQRLPRFSGKNRRRNAAQVLRGNHKSNRPRPNVAKHSLHTVMGQIVRSGRANRPGNPVNPRYGPRQNCRAWQKHLRAEIPEIKIDGESVVRKIIFPQQNRANGNANESFPVSQKARYPPRRCGRHRGAIRKTPTEFFPREFRRSGNTPARFAPEREINSAHRLLESAGQNPPNTRLRRFNWGFFAMPQIIPLMHLAKSRRAVKGAIAATEFCNPPPHPRRCEIAEFRNLLVDRPGD